MKVKIPKIIHILIYGYEGSWIEYIKEETLLRHYPDHEIKFWTRKDLEQFDSRFTHLATTNKNYDLIRQYYTLSILNEYGGLILNPNELLVIGKLPENTSLFLFETMENKIDMKQMFSIKNHPTIEKVLKYFNYFESESITEKSFKNYLFLPSDIMANIVKFKRYKKINEERLPLNTIVYRYGADCKFIKEHLTKNFQTIELNIKKLDKPKTTNKTNLLIFFKITFNIIKEQISINKARKLAKKTNK